MNAVSRFTIRHRWWILAGWVVAIAALQVLSASAGGSSYKDDFKLPGTETQAVADLLDKAKLTQQNNAGGTMVLHSTSGTLTQEPAGFLNKAKAAVCGDAGAHVLTITGPWGSVACRPNGQAAGTGTGSRAGSGSGSSGTNRRPDLLSPAQNVALVEIVFDAPNPGIDAPKATFKDLKSLRSDSLQVEFTGDSFQDVDAKVPTISPQLLGFIAAFIILGIVFRTFGATVLPLLSAAAALGSGLALLALLSHAMSVASFAPQLAELIVIGVGIDYALFIVTRHRRNLQQGMSVEDSITNALNTSGRAVLFAGTTVCIAMLGMCALGVSFLYGVAVGTSLGVALTMLASLTLLPALLALLGRRALPRSKREALPSDRLVKVLLCVIPPVCFIFWVLYLLQWAVRPVSRRLAARSEHSTRAPFWTRWAELIQRRSALFAVGAGALIVVLALPFFSMRLGHADQSNDPSGSTTRRGYDLIQSAFGKGYNSTLQLVVNGPGAADPAYLAKVADTLKNVADVDKGSVTPVPVTRQIAFVGFKSITGPQDVKTSDLVHALRGDVLPSLYRGSSNRIYVYGLTSVYVDFTKVLSAKMLLFILAVVGLSFLLLMVAFRSIVIPLTAAAMNLLAAGSSFGIVVAIFQWGWFGDTVGVGAGGPIEAFAPVIFFAVLFGLSMDYQVFLVSRMHEEWVHTRDNHRAVTVGQAETGGIITAAGLIMIAVFGGFILGDGRVIKLFGIGLASAIFLDAFIVRTMIVPSLMHLIGRGNWWYPKALDKITPQVSIEPPEADDDTPRPPETQGERELVGV
ncbi:MAG: MMPL family transporter [Actinomycetota bacterium]|nr:MMPL family transporter [Actinomycetota bacterium]